jgi:all-trans-retinol 13,14-reductase
MRDSYDAIVIGSGIGGLTAASLLAQIEGKQVLVLERHFKPGGYTHSFRRGRFSWDPGLHYVGQMGREEQGRALFDLVTGGRVEWHPLPSPMERFVYPGFEFAVPVGADNYREELRRAFPGEARSIDRYFRDVSAAAGWYARRVAAGALPGVVGGPLTWPGRGLALMTTREYLDGHFQDRTLRALLASQWADYGLPPAQSPFALHALIVSHYLDGAWYPAGGGDAIAAAVRPIVESAGGSLVVNAEVTEVLVERGAAVGVRGVHSRGATRTEFTVRAPLVLSDAGAHATYGRLLPASLGLTERVPATGASTSMVELFLGLSTSPRTLGVQGENVWISTGLDHDAAFARRGDVLRGSPPACLVSFPSLRNPEARGHTAEVVTCADHADFAAWAGRPWKRRGAEYEALKQRISEALIDLADRHLSGLRDLVCYQELATPLTLEHFGGHGQGAAYGLAPTPERLRAPALGPRTPVRDLVLTGSDAGTLGFLGALMGGVAASALVLGANGFPRIMQAAAQAARTARSLRRPRATAAGSLPA